MPEAPVHENSDSLLRENEVGITEELFVAPPAFDAVGAKQRNHSQLRVLVPAGANPRHDGAAFRRVENVRHFHLRDGGRNAVQSPKATDPDKNRLRANTTNDRGVVYHITAGLVEVQTS